MNFQFSPEVDKNKVFLAKRSEVEGRLDPSFYRPFLKSNTQRLNAVPNTKLGSIVQFSNELWDQKSIFSETFPYIEIGGVDPLTGEIYKIKDISIADAPSSAKMIVNDGDILVSTTRPSRGAISYFENKNPHIATTGFSIIRKILTISISKRFLFYWLRQSCSLYQMCQRSSGGVYPTITQEELAKIKIPVPPKAVQNQIVAKMDAAYSAKKHKKAEAQWLLDSIDAYLLGELGIDLPEQEDNTLQNRIFTTRLSEVSGGRFDPKFYSNRTEALRIIVNNSTFPKLKLKQLIIKNTAGDWGKDLYESIDGFSKCLVIRSTEFDNSFNLNLDTTRLKYRLINDKKLMKMDVKENDLLVEKSGGGPDQPVGRVSILEKGILEQRGAVGYSNFVQKIRVNESILTPHYLFCFLKTMHNIGLTDAMQSQTSGIRNLIMDDYFNQNIPIPTQQIQIRISNHITAIRTQAKTLQEEAEATLEQAKKEIEVMILGDGESHA